MNFSEEEINDLKIIGNSLYQGNDTSMVGDIAVPDEMCIINFLDRDMYLNLDRVAVKEAVKTGINIFEEIQKSIYKLREKAEKCEIYLKDLWMCFNYKNIILKFDLYIDKNDIQITEDKIILKLVKKEALSAVHVIPKLEEIFLSFIKETKINSMGIARSIWNFYLYKKDDSIHTYIWNKIENLFINYINEKKFNNKWLTVFLWISCTFKTKISVPDYLIEQYLFDAVKEIGECITHKVCVEYSYSKINGYNPERIYLSQKDINKILEKDKFRYIFEEFEEVPKERQFSIKLSDKSVWKKDINYKQQYFVEEWDEWYKKIYNKNSGLILSNEWCRMSKNNTIFFIIKKILEFKKSIVEPINATEINEEFRKRLIDSNEQLLEKLKQHKVDSLRSLIFPYREDYILRWDNYCDTSYCNAVNLTIKDDIKVSGIENLNEEQLAEFIAEKLKENGNPEIPLTYLKDWTNNEELVRKIPLYVDKDNISIENHNLILEFKEKEDENASHIIDVLKKARDKYINEEFIPDEALAIGYRNDRNYSKKMYEILRKLSRYITHPIIRYIQLNDINLYHKIEFKYFVNKKDIERITKRNKNLSFFEKMFFEEDLTKNPYLQEITEVDLEDYLPLKDEYDYESKDVNIPGVLISAITDYMDAELIELESTGVTLMYEIDDEDED